MSEINVEEIVRAIKERVDGRNAQHDAALTTSSDANALERLVQLKMDLATTARAQDKLPPLVSNRKSWKAHLELWIKRQIKRLTHWYTWEQVNFNSSVQHALTNINEILLAQEKRITTLESNFASVENQITSLIAKEAESLKDEQRVIYKQLSLEISETAVVSDRARRNAQLRIDELEAQIKQLHTMQTQLENMRQSLGVHHGSR